MNELEYKQANIKIRKHLILSILSTVVYIFLFRAFYAFAQLLFLIIYHPHYHKALGLFIFALAYCIPLSIPVSIFLIWLCYFRRKFNKIPWLCLLPFPSAIGIYGFLTAFNFSIHS